MKRPIAVHVLSKTAKRCYWSDLALADVKQRLAIENALGVETRTVYIQDEFLADRNVTHVFLEQTEANPHWMTAVRKDFPKAKVFLRLHPGTDSPVVSPSRFGRWFAPKTHRQLARECDAMLGLSDTETHRYWRKLAPSSDPFRTISVPYLAQGTGTHTKRALAVADAAFHGTANPALTELLKKTLTGRFESCEVVSKAWMLGDFQGLALLDPKSKGYLPEVMGRVAARLPVWLTYPLYDELPLELKAYCQPLSEVPTAEEIESGLKAEAMKTSYDPIAELDARVKTALSWIYEKASFQRESP